MVLRSPQVTQLARTLIMTVSVYAPAVFTYSTIAVGAWAGHLGYLSRALCAVPTPWSRCTFCGAFTAHETNDHGVSAPWLSMNVLRSSNWRWIWVRRGPGVNFSAGQLWPVDEAYAESS